MTWLNIIEPDTKDVCVSDNPYIGGSACNKLNSAAHLLNIDFNTGIITDYPSNIISLCWAFIRTIMAAETIEEEDGIQLIKYLRAIIEKISQFLPTNPYEEPTITLMER